MTYSSPIVTFLPLSCGEGIKGRGDFGEGQGGRSMPYISNNYVFLKFSNLRAAFTNLRGAFNNLRGAFSNFGVAFSNLGVGFSKLRGAFSNLRAAFSNLGGALNNLRGAFSNLGGAFNNLTAAIAFSNLNFNHFHIKNTKTQPLKSAPLSFWHYVKLKTMPKWRATGKFLIKKLIPHGMEQNH